MSVSGTLTRLSVCLSVLIVVYAQQVTCNEHVTDIDEKNANVSDSFECNSTLKGCVGTENAPGDFNLNEDEENGLVSIAESRRESRLGYTDGGSGGIHKKRKKKKQDKGFMEKMLPMMVMPFMVSTSMIPMMLVSLKFMLLKSAFIGKIAIILMLLNMLRSRSPQGGVFSHNVRADDVTQQHYGYHGDEEYGAYVNRRRKRRRIST